MDSPSGEEVDSRVQRGRARSSRGRHAGARGGGGGPDLSPRPPRRRAKGVSSLWAPITPSTHVNTGNTASKEPGYGGLVFGEALELPFSRQAFFTGGWAACGR